jgi:hypothetical protein
MQYTGISFSKYASATARSVVDTIRTMVVWVFFLMPFIKKEDREKFIWPQLVGFIMLVFGNLVFNEIISIPCFNLNYNTRKMIKLRQYRISQESQSKTTSEQKEFMRPSITETESFTEHDSCSHDFVEVKEERVENQDNPENKDKKEYQKLDDGLNV